MTRRLHLSSAAEEDERQILMYTIRVFGREQAAKYRALLDQAYEDILDEPHRATSKEHPRLGAGVRSYRIELSAARSGSGVKSSHHVIYYTTPDENRVMIVRILHDAMRPEKYLGEGFQFPSPGWDD